MKSEVHVTGTRVGVRGKIIQRCGYCGKIIIRGPAVMITRYPVNRWIRLMDFGDGEIVRELLPVGAEIPSDACVNY